MTDSVPPLRLRLKADGRLVQVHADGHETPAPAEPPARQQAAIPSPPPKIRPRRAARRISAKDDAAYTRDIRAATKLTQAEFAARIGVPIETVRNWEQGKRSPRGPARALLKVIETDPDFCFAALAKAR